MTKPSFQRIAIVNRGEPAMRLIHAVREFNREQGTDLRTIALYTDPDREAMYVREADEEHRLGSVRFTDPNDGLVKSRYLDYEALKHALVATRAEAAWVGWGFVAEHAAFADLCNDLGIVFIGPPGDVIRKLGDKITSKQLAERAKVPVAPWSGGAVESLEHAKQAANELGYPLMLKATSGGGGRGIRKLTSEADLATAFDSARDEAMRAFGDGTVFLERMVSAARHVEVQLIADSHGNAWGLGVRDCSVQRKNQKVVEESASTALTKEQDTELRAAAVRLALEAGYYNAGTVEFLYDPQSKIFSFMEVNARLQVEHPVTELTTGVDLVKTQIHVAAGGELPGECPPTRGHAVEVRLCAEDADNGFMPSPGYIAQLRIPNGPGVRVDIGFEEGDTVPSDFDSMMGKIMAWGQNRDEALARLGRVLERSAVVIDGGTTNKGFLLELLRREEVKTGAYDIGWLDRLVATGEHTSRRFAEVALVEAAIASYDREFHAEKAIFLATSARGRPKVSDKQGLGVEVSYQGEAYTLEIDRVARNRFVIDVDGKHVEVTDERLSGRERRLTCGGRRYKVLNVPQGSAFLVEVEGVPHRVTADSGTVVRAPAPAVVVSIDVSEGQQVEVGDRLGVVEAMKTETTLKAPFAGTVKSILVNANVQVDAGAPLIQIEPPQDETEVGAGRVDFGDLCSAPSYRSAQDRLHGSIENLSRLIMGYDVRPATSQRISDEHAEISQDLPWSGQLQRFEDDVLDLFIDMAAVFKKRPDPYSDDRVGAEQYFFSYLRDLDLEGAGLPETFLDKLRRAVAHYGVQDLTRTRTLEHAVFRMCKAQRHRDRLEKPIVAILTNRLESPQGLEGDGDPELRARIERLLAVTEHDYPVVHEVAREVRFRHFVQPALEEARRRVNRYGEEALAKLAKPDFPEAERQKIVAVLVDSPVSLRGFLSRRFRAAPAHVKPTILETIARRYYRQRPLSDVHVETQGELVCLRGRYTHEGKSIALLATHAARDELANAAAQLAQLSESVPPEEDVVIDIYLWRQGVPEDVDATAKDVLAALQAQDFPRPIRRLVVSVSSLALSVGKGDVEHFTFRQRKDGSFLEQRLYRGLHPMIGKQLNIWRLAEFDTERLPTQEDVYLFRASARVNPKDERLFALAEVRDMAPERDAEGQIVRLPHVERVLMEAMNMMRRFQSRRPKRQRLHWNRVILYLRPPLGIRPNELNAVVQRLVPEADGLGLERVQVEALLEDRRTGRVRERLLEVLNPGRDSTSIRLRFPAREPLRPLSEYAQRVVKLRQRGLVYPYELVRMLVPAGVSLEDEKMGGKFDEYDLDADGEMLVPVHREPGENEANLVIGVIKNFTQKYPEGMTRVIIMSDPSKDMGALAEPECRRIVAALDLAEKMRVPVEWFAVSGGAKISMQSGVENMDWVAHALRRIVNFTQDGGVIHIIVDGVTVGAQPYWNAEATMLMHTRGILIMTDNGSMVLTGKRALDFSGGVSADDNFGIGGFDRIMGPNGQAQYFARDMPDAMRILLRYYEHSYALPEERFPRRAETTDPLTRDVTPVEHGTVDVAEFDTVGDVFSMEKNPARKKPFDVRKVMRAVTDRDHEPLERWFGMRDAESAVVWDAHLGGYPVCLIGIESRPLSRLGVSAADGPDQWTAGTLFPMSSKKVARALNSASASRPAVILANLSGFDGSPESMRNLQLEYGAEIGRAVVNFDGPIVFCVISRYHGGAFVVFSNKLNDNMEVAALAGTRASVIGGAPAAAVVFSREVDRRTQRDPRVKAVMEKIEAAAPGQDVELWAELEDLRGQVYSEKLGEVAEEFDSIHSVERAQEVGSIHRIVDPASLRPYLVEAIERGIDRAT